jgi:dihydroorotate dehydrogenase (NAD+) catalytic subunit
MIELAPRHKYGLPLPGPVMPAAGAFGYGDAYRDLVDMRRLGALVTNPVSARPRHAASGQRLAVHGEHLLVHTGHPNPGLRRVLRRYRDLWARLEIPVIVHLLATTPPETARAAGRLAGTPGIAGVELGLAADVDAGLAQELVHAAREGGTLPVIARVPFGRVATLAPLLIEAGSDALTLTAPPRAVLPLPSETQDVARYMRGRLYGPARYPLLLHQLATWAPALSVPIIACGGIASPEEALACLTLGATAVQLDALLWRDPRLIERIARALDKAPDGAASDEGIPPDEG